MLQDVPNIREIYSPFKIQNCWYFIITLINQDLVNHITEVLYGYDIISDSLAIDEILAHLIKILRYATAIFSSR